MTLTIWTYDWVPQGPRGHVRDVRLRAALTSNPALQAYTDRILARPAFRKALQDQLDHFAAADAARANAAAAKG